MSTIRSDGFWWYITVEAGSGDATLEALWSAADISGSIGTEVEDTDSGVSMRLFYTANKDVSHWQSALEGAISSIDGARIAESGKVMDQQWSRQCEDAFPPLDVGASLVVLAPWHRGSEPKDRTPIYINPGSAFGTGYHASTQAALTLFERHISRMGAHASVIDIGSGSGILSIAALKLGASRTLSRDIDPAVIGEIISNMELNETGGEMSTVEMGDLLDGVDERFDVLFANILLEPNTKLLPDVPRVLRPNGAAIFSGMTLDERGRFLTAMEDVPLDVVEEIVIEEWWGVCTQSKA